MVSENLEQAEKLRDVNATRQLKGQLGGKISLVYTPEGQIHFKICFNINPYLFCDDCSTGKINIEDILVLCSFTTSHLENY